MILKNKVRVLITGSDGFIGKNLITHLRGLDIKITTYTRNNSIDDLIDLIKNSDFIVHLAGENRPTNEQDFNVGNTKLTELICEAVRSTGRQIPIIFASSIHATTDSAYGKSKLDAETAINKLKDDTESPVYIYRLPSVFGKWCKPNYNSVVATFCYNISHDLPIQVNSPSFELTLVYIDDVVEEFISIIQDKKNSIIGLSIQPEYKIKIGELSRQIQRFYDSRNSLISEKVGSGLIGKLYSTYVSYFSPEQFSYSIPVHTDERGVFAEVLKTENSGQFSFFTAGPGITRGGHYHHSKTEKFLVIRGSARFSFRHIVSNKGYEIVTSSDELKIVEIVPGWSHDITNIGTEEMIVMLWANEIFNSDNSDTITHKV